MNAETISQRLAEKSVKATANRILVYRALAELSAPASMSKLEEVLVTLDKSSIFRTLQLFTANDVVHAFEDGRGIVHYELCTHSGSCNQTDYHLHFYCENCQQSYCLESINLPSIEIPEGYKPHSASFVVKGLCPKCSKKH